MPERSYCETIVRQLWPYLDGTLSDADRERVVAHLEACERCASHMDFGRAFLEAVGQMGRRPTVSDALRDRVLAALRADGFAASSS